MCRLRRTWTYAEDVAGNGDLDDQVTIINPIAASVAEMLRNTDKLNTIGFIIN